MKGTKILLAGVLALSIALASAGEEKAPAKLPTEIVELVSAGAKLVFLDAEGNPVWSSDMGTEPENALLQNAVKLVVLDAEGNVVLELPVTLAEGKKVVVQLPDGTLVKAERLVGLGLGEGEHAEHRYQHREREQKEHAEKPEHEDHGKKPEADHENRGKKADHEDHGKGKKPEREGHGKKHR